MKNTIGPELAFVSIVERKKVVMTVHTMTVDRQELGKRGRTEYSNPHAFFGSKLLPLLSKVPTGRAGAPSKNSLMAGHGEVMKRGADVMDETLWVTDRRGVTTTSYLKVLWLVKFRGYKVRQETNEPKRGSFGGVRVVRRWFLDEPKTMAFVDSDPVD
jgi:hypothetical protein